MMFIFVYVVHGVTI